METIIKGKQFQKNAQLHSYKKRMILHNIKGEILVYKKTYGLYIPSVTVADDTNFEDEIRNKTKMSFTDSNVEELVRIINYDVRCQSINNKLIKLNLKFIREFYSCLTDFNIERLENIISLNGDILMPEIMDIDEAIKYLTKLNKTRRSDKLEALELLNEKIKEKVYETGNKKF